MQTGACSAERQQLVLEPTARAVLWTEVHAQCTQGMCSLELSVFCLQTNLMPTPPAKKVMMYTAANNIHVLIITTFTAEIHVVCYFHVHWTLSLYCVVGLCWWQSVASCLNYYDVILMEFTILKHGYYCLISCSLYSWLQHMKNQEEVKMEDV